MANIDTTELLSDPDFVSNMQIVKRSATIDELGQNTVVNERVIQTIGSIQPASGKTINRIPEGLRLSNVSDFFVKGTITADGSCSYPDILVFRGQRYEVQVIFDWTMWGAGWCEGVCVRERAAL